MATLKAGEVGDIAESMAKDIDDAMKDEWFRVKGEALPSDPGIEADRQILFVAVAQGVLKYLESMEASIETSTDAIGGGSGGEHKHHLSFSWKKGS
jgi:hypothetical protein